MAKICHIALVYLLPCTYQKAIFLLVNTNYFSLKVANLELSQRE